MLHLYSKRKQLQQDVNRLQKTINDSPLTREQFLKKEAELQHFLLTTREIDWANTPNLSPVLIQGCFDPEKPLEKRIKAAAKFLSAEEDAAKRKMELDALKARAAQNMENFGLLDGKLLLLLLLL